MMRSLYSGVSGLAIHQTKMDVIGNNIANVNTVGFKSSRVTFSEIFSQTVQSATSANENTGGTNPMQIGLGASISSIDVNMGEGASQITGNSLDLKISGDGFFVVSDASGNKFTRAGAFLVDSTGNLTTSGGLKVMGWQADADNNIQKGTVEPIQVLSADNLYSDPVATTDITLSGNINKNDDDLTGTGIPFTAQFFDSLGYSYTGNFKVTLPDATDPNTYEITLAAGADGGVVDSLGETTGITNAEVSWTVEFDPATGKVTVSDPAVVDENTQTIVAGTDLTSSFSEFSDIKIDFSGLTMFEGNSTIEAVKGDSDGLGSGSEAGTISGYEVGSDGQISGRYTNGQTKVLGQIVVANFKNPSGLQKDGDNMFISTVNSGDFDGIGEDITSNGGSFNSGTLEMSNVDLSSEFTEMITTQRGFQANSRIITTSDEMLQELVNLKR